MEKISVIIPVYRAEPYLRECLDSVLGQTYQNLEIIAVDDGSPDGSAGICQEYEKKDPRFRLLRQENAGQSAARNRGLQSSTGAWVCFVDSDDRIHPKMVELLHRAAVDGGCGISQCRMLEGTVYPADFEEDRSGAYTVLAMEEGPLAALLDADRYPGWVSCAKLIRRELVEGYPFQEGRVYEDNEAVCRWIVAAGRLADIQDALYFYRTNGESTTKSRFSLRSLDYLWALESILTFYGSLRWDQVTSRFQQRYIEAAASCYHGAKYTLGLPKKARQVEKNTWRFLRRQGLTLTPAQRETMLDTMHPKLMPLYWTASGAVRTFRQEGLRGCLKKIRRRQP